MNVLVTGGAGFIGANFVYHQLEKHPEDRIVCLDKLTYAGNLRTLERALERDNFRFVRGDIADAVSVGRLFDEEKPIPRPVRTGSASGHGPTGRSRRLKALSKDHFLFAYIRS